MARELAIEDAADASWLASVEKHHALNEIKTELHDQELDRIATIDQKAEEASKKRISEAFALGNATLNFAGAILDNVDAYGEASAESAKKIFRMRQAESISGIIMSTAEGVVAAQAAYPGPVGFALAGLLGSTAAMQIATVMAESPPSMHMGGLANDETSARVLKGEAVLDRSTVRRIGGEQGVKNLQQGGNSESGSVVIIQPFKHFGRFAKEIGYRKPRRTGIGSY